MTEIAVGLVNFNTRDLLRACLTSIRPAGPSRIVVVDNASSDGSPEMVKAEFPLIEIHENKKNLGYATAANQAIAACSGSYVLLLNSDTLLFPGTLSAICDYMDGHPDVAILGPRLLDSGGHLQRSCFPFPTPLDVFLDASNISRLIGCTPYIREHHLRSWSHNAIRSVPWVRGAALAIRREAFQQVKGFDETFFMYYEEVDLCYRLEQSGWKVHFVPEVSIVHVGGASTQQRLTEMTVQLYSSLAHFYRLHYTKSTLLQLVALVKLIAVARLVRDRLSSQLVRNAYQRNLLNKRIAAWQSLLSAPWEKEVAHQ